MPIYSAFTVGVNCKCWLYYQDSGLVQYIIQQAKNAEPFFGWNVKSVGSIIRHRIFELRLKL